MAHENFVSTIAFVGQTKLLSAGGDSYMILWDYTTGTEIDRADLSIHLDCPVEEIAARSLAVSDNNIAIIFDK
jgi:WD40 repeat protein